MDLLVENVLTQLSKENYLLINDYNNGGIKIIGYNQNRKVLVKKMLELLDVDFDDIYPYTCLRCPVKYVPLEFKKYNYLGKDLDLLSDMCTTTGYRERDPNGFRSMVTDIIMNSTSDDLFQIKICVDISRFKWYQIIPVTKVENT